MSWPRSLPAFPAQLVEGGSDNIGQKHGVWYFPGISKREYLMAHAPAEVPKWFFPIMPDCPAVPSLNGIADPYLRAAILAYWESDCDDEIRPRVIAWDKARGEAEKAQEAWQAEFRRQCVFQWPAAWADGVLAAAGI